jgi:hypothetical protein
MKTTELNNKELSLLLCNWRDDINNFELFLENFLLLKDSDLLYQHLLSCIRNNNGLKIFVNYYEKYETGELNRDDFSDALNDMMQAAINT